MIQTTRIQLQRSDEFSNKTILDAVSNESRCYVLFEDYTLSEFELTGIFVQAVVLENSIIKPNRLYLDDMYVYIGYENGTTEIRDVQDNLSYLKATSNKDPGGPGNPNIISMFATQEFFLVNTAENGLLIYIKPSILLYKWIMIELETTITSFSIVNHLLFVLTKDNEIHQLNFVEQRLDEVQIGGFEYVDLEFDGRFLYLASKQSLHVYDYHNNNQLVFSHKFKTNKISILVKLRGNLLVVLNDNYLILLRLDISNSNVNFSFDPLIKSDSDIPLEFYNNFKTRYIYDNLDDLNDHQLIWFIDNELYLSTFTS